MLELTKSITEHHIIPFMAILIEAKQQLILYLRQPVAFNETETIKRNAKQGKT